MHGLKLNGHLPVEKPEDSALVKAALTVVDDKPIIGMSPTTDASQFVKAKADFDFLLHGPGVPTLPHQLNEYIEVEDYLRFTERFQAIALEYLK